MMKITLLLFGMLAFATTAIPDFAADSVAITINPSVVVAKIPNSFLGFGYETAVLAEPGVLTDSNAKMILLYRNISSDGLIRIGGIVSDHTLYRPAGVAVVEGPSFVTIVNRHNLQDLGDFARATGWKVMWGLNGQTDSVVDGVAEAQAVKSELGDSLQSFEIGNEVNNHPEFGRNFDSYYTYYESYKAALRATIPDAPISGPDSAGDVDWVRQYAAGEGGDVKLLTDHYYCGGGGDPNSTIQKLLATDNELTAKLQELHSISQKTGVPYRFNEFNSFYNGGRPGVSDTFASALWALDVCYQMASNGCSGVNFETDINQLDFISYYSPIVQSQSGGCEIRPDYYGLLAFSITGHGDILPTNITKDDINLTAYATRAEKGVLWVTIINKDLSEDAVVKVSVPSGYRKWGYYRLTAPSVESMDQVTLGGSMVGGSGAFEPNVLTLAPASAGVVLVDAPHASAVLLQLKR